MKKHDSFNQNEIENIINRFGKPFYEKVLSDMVTYAATWDLTSLRLIPSYSANIVFTCLSNHFGPAVLKIGKPSNIYTEYHALSQYDGRRFCRVLGADIENGIILEE